ncbi:MAG: Mitochondrial ATPase complex subunit atp10 [Phylliscum demangeonii]|nr:MAG: Mitochondrial ATPase complex subunit atp10 [Phylliscum demangeonii]
MTPYFRHWVDLKYEKGKSFVAPSRLFRAERALYFPNLHGRNLLRARKARTADSTSMLKGKISIVSVFCSNWAERQVATFVNKKKHRELNELLHQYSDGTPGGNGVLQKVYVGVEQDRFKSWLVWLFMPSLRRKVPNNLHARYLVVTRGLSDELREEMGMLNKIVGYVYLVDEECRIRWAGSGDASPAEKAALIKGARRLVEANNARGMEKTAEVNKIDAAAAAAGVGKENSTASTAATKATKGAGVATAAVS